MPLAFRQWHLYRFDFMVPVVGLEPTRCRHQRILSRFSYDFHCASPVLSVPANPHDYRVFPQKKGLSIYTHSSVFEGLGENSGEN